MKLFTSCIEKYLQHYHHFVLPPFCSCFSLYFVCECGSGRIAFALQCSEFSNVYFSCIILHLLHSDIMHFDLEEFIAQQYLHKKSQLCFLIVLCLFQTLECVCGSGDMDMDIDIDLDVVLVMDAVMDVGLVMVNEDHQCQY